MPSHRRQQGNAGIHQREGRAAHGRHRRRTIGLEDIRHHTHGVGPGSFLGKHRGDGALGQRAVPDLAPSGAAQEGHLAHRERREVVVQHEALGLLAFVDFEPLHVFGSAQRGGDQRLGFATGEDGGTVRAWQCSHLDGDGANLVEGTRIRTLAVVQHLVAEDAFAHGLVVMLEFGAPLLVLLRQRLQQLLLQLADEVVALRLGMLVGVERIGEPCPNLALERVVVGLVELDRLDLALGLAQLLRYVGNGSADLPDLGVAELDGVDHRLFLHLLGARLDHHDAFGGAHHHDVEQAVAHLLVRRVDDEAPFQQADAHRANGAVKGDVGYRQRQRRAVEGGHVGIVLGVRRKHQRDHLGFAAEAFLEQRPDGAVDLAAGENLLLRRPSFALDEAAGNASAGVGVLAVVHRQGEEIDAQAGIGVGAGGGQHHVIVGAHHAGTVGLLGQMSGFKRNGLAAGQLDGGCMFHDGDPFLRSVSGTYREGLHRVGSAMELQQELRLRLHRCRSNLYVASLGRRYLRMPSF